MKYKSLLIIGGTGFFGRSILDYVDKNFSLKKKINNITVISRGKKNFFISKKINKKIKVTYIKKNIINLKKIPYADYVFYCAILKNYKDDHRAVKNYFKLAKKYHIRSKIIYTSSGAVYGQQPKYLKKFNENYFLKNKRVDFANKDRNMYSVYKLKNENIFKKLGELGLNVSIARCFAFVGKFLPRKSNYIVGNFIQSILDRQPIKIKADYGIVRSYMHTDDLVEWLLKIVSKANSTCPIYNVGSDNPVNMRTVGLYLAKRNKLSIKFNKIRTNFADVYLPSINKAKKELKLKLRYNSLKAIDDTINSLILKVEFIK
jgi:dTDP-glucose 4,6-dehydratase